MIGRGDQDTGSTAPQMDKTVDMTCETVGRPDAAGGNAGGPVVTRSLRDRLVRLAYRFLWNLDEAEDVAHDALVKAHERADDLRESDKWWSWVCRIVVHACRARGRQRQRWKRHEEPIGREASRRAEQGARADAPRSADLLRALLKELPPRQREVIVLRHLQDMPYEKIAELLEITPVTARVHARAAREKLRTLLLERHPGWFTARAVEGE